MIWCVLVDPEKRIQIKACNQGRNGGQWIKTGIKDRQINEKNNSSNTGSSEFIDQSSEFRVQSSEFRVQSSK